MTLWAANLACLTLVAVDTTARAWRLQWLLSGLGTRLPFWDAVAANSVGEALGAATPFRVGGTPAQLAALVRLRVPAGRALAAAGVEGVVFYPLLIVATLAVVVAFGGEWWRVAAPRLVTGVRGAGPWIAAIVAASILAWWLARAHIARSDRPVWREIRRAFAEVRLMPRWPVIANVPADAVLIASRVAILPVLCSTVPHGPPVGVTTFASFMLLYGQRVLPTPSGVGPVELGFLSGATGPLGAAAATLLILWRLYTTGTGVLLGVVLGVPRFAFRPLAGGAQPGDVSPTDSTTKQRHTTT